MALAALEAGVVINNSSVTIVHGMSRPIGALFHVPHGMSNALHLTEHTKDLQTLAEPLRLRQRRTVTKKQQKSFWMLLKISVKSVKFLHLRNMELTGKNSSHLLIRWRMMHWQAEVPEIQLKMLQKMMY